MELRTKLIAVTFPLPKGYETLSHPESAWVASRSKHFSPSFSAVALVSMIFPSYFFIVTCADGLWIQQKYSNINIATARKNVGEICTAKEAILKQVDALHKMG